MTDRLIHGQWDTMGSACCGISYVRRPRVTSKLLEVTCTECLLWIERWGMPLGLDTHGRTREDA